jgi:hypothetical protein
VSLFRHSFVKLAGYKRLIRKTLWLGDRVAPLLSKTQETPLIVIVLLAAILMLVGITAVSAIDFTDGKRR